MKRIGRLWRTVRHLTARQLAYQALTRLRPGRAQLRLPDHPVTGYFLAVPPADKPKSWAAGTFTFLNQPVDFNDFNPKSEINNLLWPEGRGNLIDWNYPDHGKLWTYNLNYFDFLNQRSDGSVDMSVDAGLRLIRDFMGQTTRLRDSLEPYPTSLRISNWVQFLSRTQIRDEVINRHLFAQSALLRRRLEHHIGGNHLLENGFALLTAALYFRHGAWFRRAATLVRAELSRQILSDGGHDERSPVYHQMLLDRLLDVCLAVQRDSWHTDPTLARFLNERAAQLLGWLAGITFQNGDVPMLNDAAPGIALTTAQLRAKASRVGVTPLCVNPWPVSAQAKQSGYRKIVFPRYEFVADVGAIGPDHQPGHAHADTFSFVLHVDNHPLIVDSGTSTYEIGPRRAWERSTAAHNTVAVGGENSSEVWAGFRVGRRARATVLTNTPTTLTARHDGYGHLSICHERTWLAEPARLRIMDRLLPAKAATTPHQTGVARLHFHPDVPVSLAGTGVDAGVVRITFGSESALELRLTTCEMADGFNRLRTASCVEITFTNCLETVLIPSP